MKFSQSIAKLTEMIIQKDNLKKLPLKVNGNTSIASRSLKEMINRAFCVIFLTASNVVIGVLRHGFVVFVFVGDGQLSIL